MRGKARSREGMGEYKKEIKKRKTVGKQRKLTKGEKGKEISAYTVLYFIYIGFLYCTVNTCT
jgi:hypothetical protein